MIPIIAGLAGLAAVAFAYSKAQKWDYQTPLRQAKEHEQREAPLVVACLLQHFDCLDPQRTGLITTGSLRYIAELRASASDKARMRHAIENAGPHSFVAVNPWILATSHECLMTTIGRKIGSHPETFSAGPEVAFTAEVDDYGITRADLQTYVARVNQHC